MQTIELLLEIKSKPVNERMIIVKETMQSIKQSFDERMEIAVGGVLKDYKNDEEFTAFASLDLEGFYETR